MRSLVICAVSAAALLAACKKSSRGGGSPSPSPSLPSATPEVTMSPSPTMVKVAMATVPDYHREQAGKCGAWGGGGADKNNSGCKSDKDCPNQPPGQINGRCVSRGGGHDMPHNVCIWDGCMADQDCAGGGVCDCGGDGNRCTSGNCRVDADCGAGGYCSPSQQADLFGGCGRGSRPATYFCHTPKDSCVNRQDCKGSGEDCVFAPAEQRWLCMDIYSHCPVG